MLQEFLYLFLIDLWGINSNNSYAAYTKREPDFGPSMINAYVEIFNNKAMPAKIMSHDLLKSIHKKAMAWEPSIWGYKTELNCFSSYPTITQEKKQLVVNPDYTLSEQGVFEFLDYWFIHHPNPFHYLELSDISDDSYPDFIIQDYSPKQEQFICLEIHEEEEIKVEDYEFFKKDDLKAIVESRLKTNREKITPIPFRLSDLSRLAHNTTEALTEIFKRYNEQIKNCQTNDEIISTVVQSVQRINQVHPFKDGNIRTCYILMNKLLHDHDLSLTLLMNPNRLDFCSVEELVGMVKEGQVFFQQMIAHAAGPDSSKPLELHTNDKIENLRTIICKPEKMDVEYELINNFIQHVVLANYEKIVIRRLLPPSPSNSAFFSKHEPIDSGVVDEEKSEIASKKLP